MHQHVTLNAEISIKTVCYILQTSLLQCSSYNKLSIGSFFISFTSVTSEIRFFVLLHQIKILHFFHSDTRFYKCQLTVNDLRHPSITKWHHFLEMHHFPATVCIECLTITNKLTDDKVCWWLQLSYEMLKWKPST